MKERVEGSARALHYGLATERRSGRAKERVSPQNGGQAQACDHIVRENSIILYDVATLHINSRLILWIRIYTAV